MKSLLKAWSCRQKLMTSAKCLILPLAIAVFAVPSMAEVSCKKINDLLVFCGLKSDWNLARPGSEEVPAIFLHTGKDIGVEVGSSPVANYPDLSTKIHLDWLKMSTDPQFDAPPRQIERSAAQLDGRPSETVVYMVSVRGEQFTFMATYQFGKEQIATVTTIPITNMGLQKHRSLHVTFLKTVRFKDDT
jgi:hypothetical protein